MKRNQQEVIDRILDLLTELIDDTPAKKQTESKPVEMLTIKECTEAVKAFPSIPSANWSHRDVSATSAQARASAGKSSSANSRCSTISEVRNNKAPAADAS